MLLFLFGTVFPVVAQKDRTVIGVVLDEYKEPVVGATVVVTGTAQGTTTDLNGHFTLKVGANAKSLQISYLGYKKRVVDIVTGKQLAVNLDPDSKMIEEVVVIGYGAVRKKDMTGAISVVEPKGDLEALPLTSGDQFLQGRVAGVNINSNSGAPGDAVSIQIRGTSTLSGNTSPLYVIDGFPIEAATATVSGSDVSFSNQPGMNPLASINPNDIESIQILKDASATAIYGSRATNGVVLITTKQGKEGRIKVNYNFRMDMAQALNKIDMLNAYEYGLFENELDRTKSGFDADGNLLNPDLKAPRNDEAKLDFYKKHSTDWQGLMYETSVSQDHQLSVSGGGKSSAFNITAGYTNQEGIIKNTGLDRYSFRLNYSNQLTKKLKMVINANYSQSEQKQTTHSQATSVNQMIKQILTTKPYLMPEDVVYDDGTSADGLATDNPYKMATSLKDILYQKFLVMNVAFTYNLGKGFSAKVAGNMNNVDGSRKVYYPLGTNLGDRYHGTALRGENKRQNFVLESTLNYNKTIKRHHRIDAVLGWTYEDRTMDEMTVQVADFADDDLGFNSIGQATQTVDRSSSNINTKMSSFLGRVNYSLYDKYTVTLTGRYDGSSLLAAGNNWKFFPSAAVAWRVKEENFLKDVKQLTTLKLRMSWGSTGNQNIGFAAPFSLMGHVRTPENGSAVHGMVPITMANPDLGWENTSSYNLGLEAGFIKNRYRFNVDIYKRITRDMLINFALPPSASYGNIPMNIGQISNKGIEIELGADILTGAVKWTVGGNWYLNRNNVDDLAGNVLQGQVYMAGGGTFNNSIHRTMKGYPIGCFYGYVVDGVYQTPEEAKAAPIDTPAAVPGSLKYQDISGPDGLPDGKITSDDMTVLGSSQPDFSYGFNSTLSWKGFKLSMLFTGSHGGKVANMNRYLIDGFTDTNSNISRAAWEGRWTGPGTSNYYPAVNGGNASTFFNQRFSTFLLEDGSFFRLKNVTLNYQFQLKNSSWLKSLNVFCSATNLFTITDYKGYDPEVSVSRGALSPATDFAAYPSCRTYSLGFNVGF